MEDYIFWQDVFDTYQSLSDTIKALWLTMPPLFLVIAFTFMLYWRKINKHSTEMERGRLAYSIFTNDRDEYLIYRHGRAAELEKQQEDTVLMLCLKQRVPPSLVNEKGD